MPRLTHLVRVRVRVRVRARVRVRVGVGVGVRVGVEVRVRVRVRVSVRVACRASLTVKGRDDPKVRRDTSLLTFLLPDRQREGRPQSAKGYFLTNFLTS